MRLFATPLVAVPAIVLAIKFLASFGACAKTGDWFSGCLSLAQLGVDLVYLAIGLLVGSAIRLGHNADVGNLLMSLGGLVIALMVTYFINWMTKSVARVRLAGVYKVPHLASLLVEDILNRMVAAVDQMHGFTNNQNGVWFGALAISANLSVGAAVFGWIASKILG